MSAIAIVDSGMGNLRSVEHAFRAAGVDAHLASTPEQLAGASHVVLPGVGAFPDAMKALRADGWDEALRAVADSGVPLLGICLGMQLLATTGVEHEVVDGLDLIGGRVDRLPDAGNLHIPHIGWNSITPRPTSRLLDDTPDGTDFYFVHSYAFVADDPADVAATCTYGTEFTVAVERANVVGVQFHPEKSQRMGLAILARFASWSPC